MARNVLSSGRGGVRVLSSLTEKPDVIHGGVLFISSGPLQNDYHKCVDYFTQYMFG